MYWTSACTCSFVIVTQLIIRASLSLALWFTSTLVGTSNVRSKQRVPSSWIWSLPSSLDLWSVPFFCQMVSKNIGLHKKAPLTMFPLFQSSPWTSIRSLVFAWPNPVKKLAWNCLNPWTWRWIHATISLSSPVAGGLGNMVYLPTRGRLARSTCSQNDCKNKWRN